MRCLRGEIYQIEFVIVTMDGLSLQQIHLGNQCKVSFEFDQELDCTRHSNRWI